ncbi:MAG: DUF1778 domain-containing protein [Deltaproteobacteria bacterium]|nr:DUF1778 domain-containing protein [Deltaproteobacteria bacterium]
MKESRSTQLQIRISPAQKRAIQAAARRAGRSVSAWVLGRLLPSGAEELASAIAGLGEARSGNERAFAFAEILDLLNRLSREELTMAIEHPPARPLDPYWSNYLAATIEQAAAARNIRVPDWVKAIPPLDEPVFGSSLSSLRLHLLLASPPPFAARNLFIDTALGGRV